MSCTDVTAEMQAFFEAVIEQKCEGLMVKLLESGEGITGDDEEPEEGGDEAGLKRKKGTGGKKKPLPATYEPDQRSQGWLKVKKGEPFSQRLLDVCSVQDRLTATQTTSRASATRSISYLLVLGGVKVARRAGGVQSCWRVIMPSRALWRRCASVSCIKPS